jgi:hypothetical protein
MDLYVLGRNRNLSFVSRLSLSFTPSLSLAVRASLYESPNQLIQWRKRAMSLTRDIEILVSTYYRQLNTSTTVAQVLRELTTPCRPGCDPEPNPVTSLDLQLSLQSQFTWALICWNTCIPSRRQSVCSPHQHRVGHSEAVHDPIDPKKHSARHTNEYDHIPKKRIAAQ